MKSILESSNIKWINKNPRSIRMRHWTMASKYNSYKTYNEMNNHGKHNQKRANQLHNLSDIMLEFIILASRASQNRLSYRLGDSKIEYFGAKGSSRFWLGKPSGCLLNFLAPLLRFRAPKMRTWSVFGDKSHPAQRTWCVFGDKLHPTQLQDVFRMNKHQIFVAPTADFWTPGNLKSVGNRTSEHRRALRHSKNYV